MSGKPKIVERKACKITIVVTVAAALLYVSVLYYYNYKKPIYGSRQASNR